jgi:hypothetical protein
VISRQRALPLIAKAEKGNSSWDVFGQITDLDLFEADVADDDLALLPHLHSLKRLRLGGTKISDRGLAYVGDVQSLQSLDIQQCDCITGEGIKQLCGLDNLVELNISCDRNIHDSAMRYVRNIARLERLIMHDTPITDKGAAILAGHPRLWLLLIARTKISPKGCAALEKQLPRLEFMDGGRVPRAE